MAVKFTPAPQPASRDVPASQKPLADRLVEDFGHLAPKASKKINPATDDAPKFDKTAYQRELMRQRRAADRDAGLVNVKLRGDLVAKFKATGPGWQARMNDVLAAAKI